MTQSDKQQEIQAEFTACERAIKRGYYAAAERHLAKAAHLGAPAGEVTRHGQAIRAAQKDKHPVRRAGLWYGFALAAVGYFFIALQQPLEWGMALWVFLVFLLVPVLVGAVLHRTQGLDRSRTQCFWSGMKAAGWPMAFYASATLTVLGKRLGRPDGGGEEFLAGTLVTFVYTVVAGSVAGLVNAMLSSRAAGAERSS